MGDLVTKRWTRYGKDRVYVNTADERRVACLDLATGTLQVEDDSLAQEIVAALTAAGFPLPAAADAGGEVPVEANGSHLESDGATAAYEVTAVPEPDAEPVAESPSYPAWTDLALNQPGAAAREQALIELAAMKKRSRLGTVIVRAFDVNTDERAWRRGADGEEAVAGRLAKLEKSGWRFLHAVPVGTRGSDIDHVAIGPGGVFTLNAKNHKGKKVWVGAKSVRVNGHVVPYIRNSAFEAERASRMLTDGCGFPVFATGVVVVLADELNIKQQPERVHVVGRRDVARWLGRQPACLTSAQVDAVFAIARRSTTWV